MEPGGPDPLLELMVALFRTAAAVAEAAIPAIVLLRARPATPSAVWQQQYETSYEAFERAHQEYLQQVAAFQAHLAQARAFGEEREI